MKSIFKITTLILLVSAVSISFASDFRIGVVDTERILRESVPAVQAEKKIEKEFGLRDQEMKKISRQAKEIQMYFDKEGMTLLDAEQRSKERELATDASRSPGIFDHGASRRLCSFVQSVGEERPDVGGGGRCLLTYGDGHRAKDQQRREPQGAEA